MNSSPFPDSEAQITAYLLGELPTAERAAVEQRIKEDPEWANLAKDLRRTIDLLGQVSPLSAPDDGVEDSKEAAKLAFDPIRRNAFLHQLSSAPATRPSHGIPWYLPLGIAATLMLSLAYLSLSFFVTDRAAPTAAASLPAPVEAHRFYDDSAEQSIRADETASVLENASGPRQIRALALKPSNDPSEFAPATEPQGILADPTMMARYGLLPNMEMAPETADLSRGKQLASPTLSTEPITALASGSARDIVDFKVGTSFGAGSVTRRNVKRNSPAFAEPRVASNGRPQGLERLKLLESASRGLQENDSPQPSSAVVQAGRSDDLLSRGSNTRTAGRQLEARFRAARERARTNDDTDFDALGLEGAFDVAPAPSTHLAKGLADVSSRDESSLSSQLQTTTEQLRTSGPLDTIQMFNGVASSAEGFAGGGMGGGGIGGGAGFGGGAGQRGGQAGKPWGVDTAGAAYGGIDMGIQRDAQDFGFAAQSSDAFASELHDVERARERDFATFTQEREVAQAGEEAPSPVPAQSVASAPANVTLYSYARVPEGELALGEQLIEQEDDESANEPSSSNFDGLHVDANSSLGRAYSAPRPAMQPAAPRRSQPPVAATPAPTSTPTASPDLTEDQTWNFGDVDQFGSTPSAPANSVSAPSAPTSTSHTSFFTTPVELSLQLPQLETTLGTLTTEDSDGQVAFLADKIVSSNDLESLSFQTELETELETEVQNLAQNEAKIESSLMEIEELISEAAPALRGAPISAGSRTESHGLGFMKEKKAAAKQPAPRFENLKRELSEKSQPKLSFPHEQATDENPTSTFSLNVSDVSFQLAAASLERGIVPDSASIRPEEFFNALNYHDPVPTSGGPVTVTTERALYPFGQQQDILRISVNTHTSGRNPKTPLNLVVLLDNSGSMERPDRQTIIRRALESLLTTLNPNDLLSVITFARQPRLRINGVAAADALPHLAELLNFVPEGGTNLEAALISAYATARKHFQAKGQNRIILLTDGAANLGNTEADSLREIVVEHRQQGIALDCFGIGWDGYDDYRLESLTRNGDGRYAFLNRLDQVDQDFQRHLTGALNVAAKNVKVQITFNPSRVSRYRQIGYAKHQLKKEDFRDNTVDAAEIAAAEAGTALYLLTLASEGSGPIGELNLRYQDPQTGVFQERMWPLAYAGPAIDLHQATPSIQLATAAALFAEKLAGIPYSQSVSLPDIDRLITRGSPRRKLDPAVTRLEQMVQQARSLSAF